MLAADCCEDQARQEGEGPYDCEQGAGSLIKPPSVALFCPDLRRPSMSDLADSYFLPCHLLVFMTVHFSMFGLFCDHEAINIYLSDRRLLKAGLALLLFAASPSSSTELSREELLSLGPSPCGRTSARVRRWPLSPEDLFMLCRVTLILKLWLRDLNLDSLASSHGMDLKCIPQGLTFLGSQRHG